MGRVLVMYASHFGQTRKVSERIGEWLRALGHEVDLVDVRYLEPGQPAPEDYDVVVLGSRVEVGKHAGEIRNYVRSHVDRLRKMPTVFFSVSMAAARRGASSDPAGYMESMFDELGWKPTHAMAIGGGLPYRRYGWLMRFLISASAARPATRPTSRNHEFTDWERVDELANEVAALLPAESLVRWI